VSSAVFRRHENKKKAQLSSATLGEKGKLNMGEENVHGKSARRKDLKAERMGVTQNDETTISTRSQG